LNEDFIRLFFESAITEGIETAVEKFWDLPAEELVELMKQMSLQPSGLFGNFDPNDENLMQVQDFDPNAFQRTLADLEDEVRIGSVNVDDIELRDKEEEGTASLLAKKEDDDLD